MHALDLRDNALQWETERQNRILQDAAEQKKKQARLDTVRHEQTPAAGAEGAPAVQLNEWIDKVNAIPGIRSALIPIDDAEGWSKPFSLARADMEPWLSFFNGYRQSRLFLHSPPQTAEASDQAAAEACIDYPVRALLELKRASVRLILEPPVQINGQVEYFDTEDALNNSGQDSSQFRALLRNAVLTHDRQLKLAEQKGREMGDMLYEALMGEGHANLIKSWEKVYRRKPTVEELHQMLSSGRIKAATERKAAQAGPRLAAPEPARPAAVERPALERRVPALPKEMSVPPVPAIEEDEEAIVTLSSGTIQKTSQKRTRKLLWHLLHAAIGCAALAAYIFVF